MNWPKLIQDLCTTKKLSIRQLAKAIDINHVFLSEVARDARPASPRLRLRLLIFAGVKLNREAVVSLLPDEVAKEIRDQDKATKTKP